MKTASKIALILGGLASIGLLIWAKTGSAVNFVKNLTFEPLWYGGLNDMKISTAGIKLPLAVDLGNRSDQRYKVRINAVDAYHDGSKIAASTPSYNEVVLEPYGTQRMKLDVTIGWSFLKEIGVTILNAAKYLDKIMDYFNEITLRVDFTVNDTIQTPLLIDFATGEVKVDGVGLVQSTSHRIAPLCDYVHLIPSKSLLRHNDDIVIEDVTPEETASYVRDMAKKCSWHTKKLANQLRNINAYETVRNIFYFVYNHIQYTPDSTTSEDVRTPLRTLWDQKGDCDCMTLLICSLFENLGIPYTIRIAEYDNKGYYQHIYALAQVNGRLVACDPVVERFDYEKPFTNKKDF